ncbi:hypothetical protein [Faecalibaculum rodentium]|uniref:hypothetical protein n=1 Tax=Faecalibaculum rodentium TaxID=1702221 RepID=UPI0023F507A9|nr:hypothetical protein [Faecalibaculum rodentium]
MITKMLKVTLAASMAMPAVSAILPGNTVFAQELPAEAVTENTMDTTIGSGLEMTDIIETPELDGTVELPMLPEQAETEIVLPETGEITEETVAPEVTETVTEDETAAAEEEAAVAEKEESDLDARRGGTDVGCGLTLNTRVNGVDMTVHDYQVGADQYDVQLGGTLDMKKVWSNYDAFKMAYILKNGKEAFRSKALVGSYDYTFTINTDVVTVNEDILLSTDAWQEAFETGSGAAAVGFFHFMKCSGVTYNPTTGEVKVTFTINENGTGQVKVASIEDSAGSKPKEIFAYSPEGAMVVKNENFKKGASVFVGKATFRGEIDMAPWMALIFPIRFEGCIEQENLTLDVQDASVHFDVINGTWADGTKDTITEAVKVDVIKLSEGSHMVAGTLEEHQIPTGMIAETGYVQESGAWDNEPTTEENATIFHKSGVTTRSNGLSIGYTYSFPGEPGKPEDPDNPEQPDTPVTPEKPDQPDTPEKPDTPQNPGTDEGSSGSHTDTDKKPDSGSNNTNIESKPASKVPTAAATGLGFTLGLQALSVAGILAILKKKRSK